MYAKFHHNPGLQGSIRVMVSHGMTDNINDWNPLCFFYCRIIMWILLFFIASGWCVCTCVSRPKEYAPSQLPHHCSSTYHQLCWTLNHLQGKDEQEEQSRSSIHGWWVCNGYFSNTTISHFRKSDCISIFCFKMHHVAIILCYNDMAITVFTQLLLLFTNRWH